MNLISNEIQTLCFQMNNLISVYPRIKKEAPHMDKPDTNVEFPTLSDYREKIEKNYLQMLLDRVQGDREKACRLSGISQSRLKVF